jgi:hypothetical protein
MINEMVINAVDGIVWKNEFPQQYYDMNLILQTYHELQNPIKENHKNMKRDELTITINPII